MSKDTVSKWVSIGITVTVLVIGLVASWSQAQSDLEYFSERIGKLESTSEAMDSVIDEIRIKQHGNEQLLLTIKESLEEIKVEIRRIKERM